MKITRYYQSCLLVEEGAARLLIDPSGHEAADADKFGKLDAVFYTHEHADHFDPDLAEKFKSVGAQIYANASTAKQMKRQPTIVENNQALNVAGVEVKALELSHCPMPDGSAGPQNTGYLIEGKLFHPGDGKELAGLSAEVLAVPMLGPDVSVRDACDFTKQVNAKTAIPIHYDVFSAKPDFFVNVAGWFNMPFSVKPLANGQSLQV